MSIQVAAETQIGTGPYSSSVSAITLEDSKLFYIRHFKIIIMRHLAVIIIDVCEQNQKSLYHLNGNT